MKKIAIALSVFPGSLLIIALISYIICFIAELGLPGGSANIGLGILLLALLINIPTIIVWIAYLTVGKAPPKRSRPLIQPAEYD